MAPSAKTDWLVAAGLIALSFIPMAAGALRMVQLVGGAVITADKARFFAAPLPVKLHVVSAMIYCALNAFQFSPRWHRAAGRLLVPFGPVVALSALWMLQFYPVINFDGPFLYGLRLLAGTAMALFFCLGLGAARRS